MDSLCHPLLRWTDFEALQYAAQRTISTQYGVEVWCLTYGANGLHTKLSDYVAELCCGTAKAPQLRVASV
jgi:hypothetical protein